jgi:Ca2+-binding EF-hand superfamily protein
VNDEGFISKDSLTKILEAFYKLVGPQETLSGKKYDRAQQLADDLFENIDTNHDDKITFAEYTEGAIKHPDIMAGLQLWVSNARGSKE